VTEREREKTSKSRGDYASEPIETKYFNILTVDSIRE
jgi:hypothetical protein